MIAHIALKPPVEWGNEREAEKPPAPHHRRTTLLLLIVAFAADTTDNYWQTDLLARGLVGSISDLNAQVNDLRGKFVKPTLKKVSKYENKFAKLQKKAAEFNFRNQLKVVKKKEFTLEEEDKE
ncbi:hypothetical protein AND_008019 [Anopheles darlingi]|uniref:Uncharacterized protein n=1 Tax=Anopheles darlingi TaxID=43151 RepID=W5J7C9_ANODA|nr:hypothetical protein AND_008019 [Anopheles darlingi]